jgi:hypothetical protein
MPWLADVPMVSPFRKLEYEEKQAVLMFARRYPLLGKARADEIARIWTDRMNAETFEDGSTDPKAEIREASRYLLGIAHTLGGPPNPMGNLAMDNKPL